MDNLQALCERIDGFSKLGHDWDSYGSAPISSKAIETAKLLVKSWQAVPLNGGGVQVELHIPGGEIEIEIDSDGKVAWAGAFDENNNILKED